MPFALLEKDGFTSGCACSVDYHFARIGRHTDIMTRIFKQASWLPRSAAAAACTASLVHQSAQPLPHTFGGTLEYLSGCSFQVYDDSPGAATFEIQVSCQPCLGRVRDPAHADQCDLKWCIGTRVACALLGS